MVRRNANANAAAAFPPRSPPIWLAGVAQRHHVCGAPLEQAVGEPAGGGADVQAAPPGGVDPCGRQRVGQLAPAAGDELRCLVDRDVDVVGHELPGLLRAAAIRAQPHLARDDRRGRAAARGKDPAPGQQGIEPDLRGLGHRAEPYRLPFPPPPMAGRVTSLVARGRRVRWQLVLSVALRIAQEGRRRWERLSKREQQELSRILRKSRGRPARLIERERQELWRIVRKAIGPE